MKVAKVTVAGKERALTLSSRVIVACADRYGGMENISSVFDSDDVAQVLRETAWLLSQMMQAGAKYLASLGEDTEPPMSEDDILDYTTPADINDLKTSIFSAIATASKPDVEVESKNGQTTPGEQSRSG